MSDEIPKLFGIALAIDHAVKRLKQYLPDSPISNKSLQDILSQMANDIRALKFAEGEWATGIDVIKIVKQIVEAIESSLEMVDEAYTATGYTKIGPMSKQRLKILQAIAKGDLLIEQANQAQQDTLPGEDRQGES